MVEVKQDQTILHYVPGLNSSTNTTGNIPTRKETSTANGKNPNGEGKEISNSSTLRPPKVSRARKSCSDRTIIRSETVVSILIRSICIEMIEIVFSCASDCFYNDGFQRIPCNFVARCGFADPVSLVLLLYLPTESKTMTTPE